MQDFQDDHQCFVCGPDNPLGLKLTFQVQEGVPGVWTELAFPSHLQGWARTVHGGLLATVLDEAMIKAAASQGFTCVTAEINVKYRKPVATLTPYRLFARHLDRRGPLLRSEACLQDAAGETCALATGKLFQVG